MPVHASNRARIAVSSLGLFFASLLLTAYSAKNPWTSHVGGWVIGELLRPFEILHSSTSSSVSGLWSRYVALIGVEKENTELHERLAYLEGENARLAEVSGELERLRSLLSAAPDYAGRKLAASVIGWDPSNWVKAATIDKGATDGVEPGMAVVQEKGVVGQVAGVSLHTARVLLITDHSSGVDAIVQGSRFRGVVQGDGEGCSLEYLPSDEAAQVHVGDRVVTSGMDGVYAKGLVIGVVLSAPATKQGGGLFQTLKVQPTVDFRRLENVLVLRGELPSPSVPAEKKPLKAPKKG